MNATITSTNNGISINTPYSAGFVSALKDTVPSNNRKWNGNGKTWEVSSEYAEAAREITRQFFTIEGEASQVEYEIVTLKIQGCNTYKRTYHGSVTVDGCDLITSWGTLSRSCAGFEVLKSSGGYTSGDGNHAHSVEFTVTLKVRKGAQIENIGHANYWGSHETISRQAA